MKLATLTHVPNFHLSTNRAVLRQELENAVTVDAAAG